jgi:hypothetical protein
VPIIMSRTFVVYKVLSKPDYTFLIAIFAIIWVVVMAVELWNVPCLLDRHQEVNCLPSQVFAPRALITRRLNLGPVIRSSRSLLALDVIVAFLYQRENCVTRRAVVFLLLDSAVHEVAESVNGIVVRNDHKSYIIHL